MAELAAVADLLELELVQVNGTTITKGVAY
jgi:hypothetical protein